MAEEQEEGEAEAEAEEPSLEASDEQLPAEEELPTLGRGADL